MSQVKSTQVTQSARSAQSAQSTQQIGVAKLTQIDGFDEIIDVRSPAEYAQDHLPGAVNLPVLNDAQRAHVGTIYTQESPFAAKKIGAALIARNIAGHLEQQLQDRPRNWRPLVYCWRGGQRSSALVHILRQIGWPAHRLEGGYKLWRQHVIAQLDTLPAMFRYRVIAGATGSGKTRLLEALADRGAQVLHLEQLAAHKGSVLGPLPDMPQPSQKMFESRLHLALRNFDPAQPVFVEAESRRIGTLHLPAALFAAIRQSPTLQIEAPLSARIDFLLRDYAYFLQDPHWLLERLSFLRGLQSNATLARWQDHIASGDFHRLVSELLEQHYDPLYRRSQPRGRPAPASDRSKAAGNDSHDHCRYRLEHLADAAILALADKLFAQHVDAPNDLPNDSSNDPLNGPQPTNSA
ncbi:MAG: tRNA 2-selenouridine(34) synthase MnmH [Sterolibacterium sp.]|nr:tRNA 2-selenouridine(34) synthase MnmH [Sterolibacterium sp.]